MPRRLLVAHLTQPCQPSPEGSPGRPAHRPFRGLLGVHSRCGLHTRAVTVFRDPLSEGFRHFVTSMPAPVASGWSGRRVGLAPTGKRRLSTAHTQSGLSTLENGPPAPCRCPRASNLQARSGATASRHGCYVRVGKLMSSLPILIVAMRRHGRRVLAMASRSVHKRAMPRFPMPALLVR